MVQTTEDELGVYKDPNYQDLACRVQSHLLHLFGALALVSSYLCKETRSSYVFSSRLQLRAPSSVFFTGVHCTHRASPNSSRISKPMKMQTTWRTPSSLPLASCVRFCVREPFDTGALLSILCSHGISTGKNLSKQTTKHQELQCIGHFLDSYTLFSGKRENRLAYIQFLRTRVHQFSRSLNVGKNMTKKGPVNYSLRAKSNSCVPIKLYWQTAMTIHLHVVYVYFWGTMAKLNIVTKAIWLTKSKIFTT